MSMFWMRSIYNQRQGTTEYMGLPYDEAIPAYCQGRMIHADSFMNETREETLAKLNEAYVDRRFGDWAVAYMRFLIGLDERERGALDRFDDVLEDHILPAVAMDEKDFGSLVHEGRSPLDEQKRRVDVAACEVCSLFDVEHERHGFGAFKSRPPGDEIAKVVERLRRNRCQEDVEAATVTMCAVADWLGRWKLAAYREILADAFEMIDRIHERIAESVEINEQN